MNATICRIVGILIGCPKFLISGNFHFNHPNYIEEKNTKSVTISTPASEREELTMNLFSIVSASAVGILSAVILFDTVPFPSRFSSCTVVFTAAITQPRVSLTLMMVGLLSEMNACILQGGVRCIHLISRTWW